MLNCFQVVAWQPCFKNFLLNFYWSEINKLASIQNSIESIRECVWPSTSSAETYAAALHSVTVAPRTTTRTKQDVCRVLSQVGKGVIRVRV